MVLKRLMKPCDRCGNMKTCKYVFGKVEYILCDQCIFNTYKGAFEVLVKRWCKSPNETKDEIMNIILAELIK